MARFKDLREAEEVLRALEQKQAMLAHLLATAAMREGRLHFDAHELQASRGRLVDVRPDERGGVFIETRPAEQPGKGEVLRPSAPASKGPPPEIHLR